MELSWDQQASPVSSKLNKDNQISGDKYNWKEREREKKEKRKEKIDRAPDKNQHVCQILQQLAIFLFLKTSLGLFGTSVA